jgi:tetratricopeptide (TPR) repeat protein
LVLLNPQLTFGHIVPHVFSSYDFGEMGLIFRFFEWILEPILNSQSGKSQQKRGGMADLSDSIDSFYKKGDYANALAMTDVAIQHGMDLSVFRADLIMQQGKLDVAEEILTKALEKEQRPTLAALANCVLGRNYILQGWYDKAYEPLRNARIQWAERGATYSEIAELCLRRGEDLKEALRLAKLGLEKDSAGDGISPETRQANLATGTAILAWASATVNHDTAEVEGLASKAVGLSATIAVTDQAKVHVCNGMAFQTLGLNANAASHFESASQIDPQGYWGREAQKRALIPCAVEQAVSPVSDAAAAPLSA